MNNTAILSQSTGWLLLGLFSIAWVFLGWLWGKKAKGLDGYMLAGRNVGMSLATATAMATWVTTNTTMAAPQLAYQMGVWGMIGYSMAALGLVVFAPMAKRIRDLMPNGYTSGDYVRLRYGKFGWYVFLAISIFYGMAWLISMGMAGGILLNALTGVDYQMGMTVILFICMLYTMLGGMYAVIGTDFIQSMLILVGLVIVACMIFVNYGFEPVYQTLSSERPGLLNLLFPAALMFLFNNLLFGIGEICHSNVWWSRAFAFRQGVGLKAYLLAGFFWIPVPIVAGSLALAAPFLGMNIPSVDMVGPMVAAQVMGSAGAVIFFIIVFSSLASSLDSLLAASSDLLVEDIYRRHFAPQATDDQLRRASVFIIAGLSVAAWLVCWQKPTHLAGMLHLSGALVGSTVWPIIAGLYWRKTNPMGASFAMILGSGIGLWCYFNIGFYVAALVGAAVSMVVVLGTTLLLPKEFDWNDLDETHTPVMKGA